ncbi:MAG: FkbM family methyltransferase [Microthrixaceae bacterium]
MARVFLDVGAHVGETLAVVIDRRWGFDRIYCFEPSPDCWEAIESLADDRVELSHFGLWSSDTTMELHDSGEIGASLFETKALGDGATRVELHDATEWFADNVSHSDQVVMKLNCEGAECEVLDRLLDSGEIHKVDELVVHFDVRKVPGMEHREAITRHRLEAAGVHYDSADEVFFGRNVTEKTANWLDYLSSGPLGRFRHRVLRRAEHAARVRLYRLRQSYKAS